MKRCFSFAAGLLYVLATVALLFYFVISWNPYLLLSPAGRIVCLGGSCLCLYLGSLLLAKTLLRERAAHVMKVTFVVMFAAYLLLLLTFTLFDTYFTRSGFSALRDADMETYRRYLREMTNFVPLRTIRGYLGIYGRDGVNTSIAVTNLAGNLLAFMPFALFMPLLWNGTRQFWRFAACMVLAAVLIETAQFLLLTGSCDIDDVLLNAGGACLFYGFLHIRPVRAVLNRVTVTPY